MPKKSSKPFWGGGRGRPNNNPPDEKHYFGHDDRTRRSNDSSSKFMKHKPKVSFKRQNYKTDRNSLIKQQFHDDDVMMSATGNNNVRSFHNRPRKNSAFVTRRHSPLPHGNMRNGRPFTLPVSESNWYKVIIPRGNQYTKDFVLGNIKSYINPVTFTPVVFKIVGEDAVFYVEDHSVASKIAECNRKITVRDGEQLQVRVKPGVPPVVTTDALKERLKQAMGKRYIQENNALDLSTFYHDPELAEDYWCPLARPNMLMLVLDIVQEHIPNLEALNLDSNKLYNIDKLGLLGSKFEKLKILYIGDNKIKEMNYLNVLKNLQLEELRIAGNPVCNKYKNRNDDYVSDVRKKFPKLLKLDGIELPPPILFDLEDQKTKLPSSQRIFIAQANEKAKDIVTHFLQEYFAVFDSDNRQPLLAAYHEHACFSMTSSIPQSSNKFNQYMMENRNLCRVVDSNRRRKLLKMGRLPVVSFISEMPRTKHDLNNCTLDLSLVTEGMVLITLTGLFKELYKDNKENIRYFNRTIIIVPEGAGFCISNEQLHISNPTQSQEKLFNDAPPVVEPTPGPSSMPVSVVPTEEIKQQMTIRLQEQTNMNIEWSLKCLEEVQWNFENACVAFQEAFKSGKIPDIAFKN